MRRPSAPFVDQRRVVEHAQAERVAARAQPGAGEVDVAAVELVVAGDEDDRHRPAGEAFQPGPGAVDVAGQHQQLGIGRRHGVEALALQVQVGQQLQLHGCARPCAAPEASGSRSAAARHAAPAPWQRLYFLPLPHGHGSLRPTLGAVAAHGVDLKAQFAREVVDVGHRGDEVVDRVVDAGQRQLGVHRRLHLALLVVLGRQVAVDAHQRQVDRVVVEFLQRREAGRWRSGSRRPTRRGGARRRARRARRAPRRRRPGRAWRRPVPAAAESSRAARRRRGGRRHRHRQRHRTSASASASDSVPTSAPSSPAASSSSHVDDQRIEGAVLGERTLQRLVPAQHEGGGAVDADVVGHLGRQPPRVGVEDVRQPLVGRDLHRLHEHAAQVAVEGDDAHRAEGPGNARRAVRRARRTRGRRGRGRRRRRGGWGGRRRTSGDCRRPCRGMGRARRVDAPRRRAVLRRLCAARGTGGSARTPRPVRRHHATSERSALAGTSGPEHRSAGGGAA